MRALPTPAWGQELLELLPTCSHFLLYGNIHDKFYIGVDALPEANGTEVLKAVPELLSTVLLERGAKVVVSYDITSGAAVLTDVEDPEYVAAQEKVAASALTLPEEKAPIGLPELAPPGPGLTGLKDLIERVSQSQTRVALVITASSRLRQSTTAFQEPEFQFFRDIDAIARSASCIEDAPGGPLDVWFNPVIWLLDNDRDVPDWFALDNAAVRSIVLPLPDSDEREKLARTRLPSLDKSSAGGRDDSRVVDAGPQDFERAVGVFRDQMAGLTLNAMESVMDIARAQEISLPDIADAVRFFQIGVAENPWQQESLVTKIRAEVSDEDPSPGDVDSRLSARVLGQERAVRKVVDILARSASGLTAAHASLSATRPRGVLFFAGPTGVGKTELAKALAQLVFGHENRMIRFDMSEFSAEQSEARLIGAPPGFVGFDAGGQLTKGIRMQPFSVVLFDEVEKAHPRILDKFLQVLDDGRLTDGRGDTVSFTEAIIIFTSNRGVYRDVLEAGNDGRPRVVGQKLAVRQADPFPVNEPIIREAISQYFKSVLGRPELLNRIGEGNIVVFDFIRNEPGNDPAKRILEQMLSRIKQRVLAERHVTLALHPGVSEIVTANCLSAEVLENGARGIGNQLEIVLTNPLAERLFVEALPDGATATIVALEEQEGMWTAQLERS